MATNIDMLDLIEKFFSSNNAANKNGSFKIYIESSLQFELGIYLRANLPEGYNVEVERNVYKMPVSENGKAKKFAKERIDLFVYNADNTEKYAIELKYPRNAAYPRRFGKFIEDIEFMDQVAGLPYVQKTYCLAVATDQGFYSGNIKKGVNEAKYRLFRTHKEKQDTADKPEASGKPDEDRYKVAKRHYGEKINGLVIEWNLAKDKEGNPLYQRDGEEDIKVKTKKEAKDNKTATSGGDSNECPVYFYLIEIDGANKDGKTQNV